MNTTGRLLFAFCLMGCGTSATTGPSTPTIAPDAGGSTTSSATASSQRQPTGMQVDAEVGAVDAAEVEAVFRKLDPVFLACQKDRLGDVDEIAGELKLVVRLRRDGVAKWARIVDSTVGDSRVEACIMQASRAASWPSPDGREGEISRTFELAQLSARGEPSEWKPERVRGPLAGVVSGCRLGQKRIRITAYVVPDGRSGRARAVGVSSADELSVADVECVVAGTKRLSLPSPGSWTAKVSVQF